MLLENKNAVVYGAGGAIGGAVAQAFAREGADDFGVSGCLTAPSCDLGHRRSWSAGLSRLLLVSTTNGDVMKILIARASAAIGGQRVAQLVAGGHEVVGTTRSAAKTGALRGLGVEPVIVDALDPDSVASVVVQAEPNLPADVDDGVAALRHLEKGLTP
jgi:NADP-dependent 3-hydroxy acid dehydrogenase YdfG